MELYINTVENTRGCSEGSADSPCIVYDLLYLDARQPGKLHII